MHVEAYSFERKCGWSKPFGKATSEPTLILAFGAPSFFDSPELFAELAGAYPGAIVAGCSTAGEIAGTTIHDESLSVAVVHLERTQVRFASARVDENESSANAGSAVAGALMSPDLRAVFVLSDGVCVNGSELLRGMNSILPASVIVTGGLAADGSSFKRTWVLAGAAPVERTVVAIGFYGDAVDVRHGSRGGWDIFGPERTVTRSAGNVLYELDGEPALRLYEQYLGDRAKGLPSTALLFPLALRATAQADTTLVRTVLAVDAAQSSMTFAGDIPQGARVQLMRANFDRLIEGAGEAGRDTADVPAGESLVIAISCVGRRLVLGERTEEEVEALSQTVSPDAKILGFYSYGEISPFANGRCADLHNQTMTVTTISER